MAPIQQPLPGLEGFIIAHKIFSNDPPCGHYYDTHSDPGVRLKGHDCTRQSDLLAIWFIMGSYNGDDIRDGVPKELLGYDCLFDDSNRLYTCSAEHMIHLIEEGCLEDADIDSIPPEIIVNSRGEIDKGSMKEVYTALGEPFGDEFFTEKSYSQGRESIESFWEREKNQLGF